MKTNATNQLLVGLDSVEWDLVVRWSREGKLPTFRRLMQQGTRAELLSTADRLPDTAWACLCTGVNPAKLERFFYVQYDPRTMGLRYLRDDVITRLRFWDYMSQAGMHVGVVDVPELHLSRSLNGFQLANWGAHAARTPTESTPPSLAGEVNLQIGRHPVGQWLPAKLSDGL